MSSAVRTLVFAGVATLTLSTSAAAQSLWSPQPLSSPQPRFTAQPQPVRAPEPVSLSGPRFGVTFLNQAIVDTLATEHEIEVSQTISQFGWQFEKRIYTGSSGLTVLNEWVVLAGGLDQGVVLPSITWLAGLRTKEGAEIGIGPNITPIGVGLAIAAGTTFRAGSLNVPVNLAVVPSKSGVRISFLTGFNMKRR